MFNDKGAPVYVTTPGQYRIPPDKLEAFNKEMYSVFNKEQEFDIDFLNINELKTYDNRSISIKPKTIKILSWLFN